MDQDMPEGVIEASPASESVCSALRLTEQIMRLRTQKLSAQIKSKPRTSLWASQIPECERQGVYEFLDWDKKLMHDWKLEALFEAGRVQETAFKSQLRDLGVELVEDGVPISDDMRSKYGINGYLDTRIKWEGKRVPVEIKMMSPSILDKIRSGVEGINDMKRFAYMRKYVRQGLVYLLGTNEEVLVFAFTDGRGNWRFPVLELDYDEAERILNVAERIKKHVAAKTYPDRIPYDHDICGKCAFATICIPDIKNDPRLRMIEDAKIGGMLELHDQLKEKASQYAKVDKVIRSFFEDIKDGIFTLGNFIVTRKATTRTEADIPPEILAKYQKKVTTYRNTIERYQKPDPESIYLDIETDKEMTLRL